MALCYPSTPGKTIRSIIDPKMNNHITGWFQKPYPLVESAKEKLGIALGSGIIVVFILIIIRPFGIESSKEMFPFLLGFGFIDFMVTAMHLFLFPMLFPTIIKSSDWTTGKNVLGILWILFTIAIVNYFYGQHLGKEAYVAGLESMDNITMISWIVITFSVGAIPVVFILYILEKYLFQRNRNRAASLSKGIKKQSDLPIDKPIELKSSKETILTISASDLICVKAEGGNYATVFWHEGTVVKKEMIRLTLVGFLEKTSGIPTIVRCHKSYIINRNKVVSFQGNARSVMIVLDGMDFKVPASRSFPKEKLAKQG